MPTAAPATSPAASPSAPLAHPLSLLPTAEQMAALVLRDDKQAFVAQFRRFITPKVRARLKQGDARESVDAVIHRTLVIAGLEWGKLRLYVGHGITGGTPAAACLHIKLGHFVGDAIKAQMAEDSWNGHKAQSLDFDGPEGDGPGTGPARQDKRASDPAEESAANEMALAFAGGADHALRTAAYGKFHAFLASQGENEPAFTPEELCFKFRTGSRTLGQVLEACRADLKEFRNLVRTGDRVVDRRLATMRAKADGPPVNDAPTPQAFAKAGELMTRMGSDEGLADYFGLCGTPEQRRNAIQRWRSDALAAHQRFAA